MLKTLVYSLFITVAALTLPGISQALVTDTGLGASRSVGAGASGKAAQVVLSAVTAADGTKTLTAKDCGKVFVWTSTASTYDMTYTLPKAIPGCSIKFYGIPPNGSTIVLYIDPDGTTDQIYYTGLTPSAGDRLSTVTAGGWIELLAVSSTEWIGMSAAGTWLDAN